MELTHKLFYILEKLFDVDPSVIVVEEGATSVPLHFARIGQNSKFVFYRCFIVTSI